MNKKRLFYILGAVAFFLYGVASILLPVFSSILREVFGMHIVVTADAGTIAVAIVCFLTFVLLMIKAFVNKMPRQMLIAPFAILLVSNCIALVIYAINFLTVIAGYGLPQGTWILTFIINSLGYLFNMAAALFAILYICLKNKMPKLFFLPCVLMGVGAFLSFAYSSTVYIINAIQGPIEMLQGVILAAATFSMSLLLVAAYFFVCFAVSKEEKPQAVAITEGENAEAQATEAYASGAETSGATENSAPAAMPAPVAASQTKEKEPEGYENIAIFLLLYFLTGGIWLYVWFYRQTKFLNADKTESPRDPVLQTLLCVFVPYYWIYWTYKSAERIDRLAKARGISSDLKVLCTVLCFVVTIVPPILMILKVNEIVKTPAPVAQAMPVSVCGQTTAQTAPVAAPVASTPVSVAANATNVSEDLKKYKELLDSGAITQEEYDAVKKRLLGL